MKTKRYGLSSRAGRERRWLLSSVKSIWMEGKALSSLGIRNTLILDPDKSGSKFEYTPPRPLPKPILPVIPHHLSKPKTPVTTFAGRNVRQEVRAIVFTLYSWKLTGRSRF